MPKVVLSVQEIAGPESERRITEAIGSLPGVEDVEVNLAEKKVVLSFDDLGGDLETVWRVLSDEGFQVNEATTL